MSLSIIVPLDGSPFAERALPIASHLARRSGGSIVLFTAHGPGVPADTETYLDAKIVQHNMHAKHKIVDTSDIPQALADVAAAHGDPAIIMSSRGPTAIDDLVIGSVTADTLRLTGAPILLLGPHLATLTADPTGYETLLVCVDGSPESETILPVARRWAKILALKVWVVQVVDPDATKASDAGLSHETLNESGYVHRRAELLGGDAAGVAYDVLHETHPAKAILRYAEGLPRPIIAMATHGRTGRRRITMGSVTMAVVRHAACPVLVIRPEDLKD